MMVSKQAVERHRQSIVLAASRLFRAQGFAAVRVADVMAEAGLTHGGFYRHFTSKEHLAAAACDEACADNRERFGARADDPSPRRTLAREYLSTGHLRGIDEGCLFAALGPEVARAEPGIREAVATSMADRIKRLAALQPGTPKERRARAITTLAGLLGTLVLARIATDEKLANEILSAGLAAFGDE